MSLLQDPYKSLKQISWYLDKQNEELFPGACLLAAGNLCRQLLEQIIFILAFYSGLPNNKYLKKNLKLKNINDVLQALNEIEKDSNQSYIEKARLQGKRISKFARFPKTFELWRKKFNESSHYVVPLNDRKIKEKDIRKFVSKLEKIIDEQDQHLITIAINDIKSNGEIKALLTKDRNNNPCIQFTSIISPKNLNIEEGKLILDGEKHMVQVVSNTDEIPKAKITKPILIEGSSGYRISFKLITKNGVPINLTSIETVLASFSNNENDLKALLKRLKVLGVSYQLIRN